MRKFKKYLFFLLFLICPVFALAEQIDINTATLLQLDKLTGIGPIYAQRIIDSRTYSSVDDLLRVKGIGPATLQKIKTQGFACVNCQGLTISTSTESIETTNSIKHPPQADQPRAEITNNETPTTSILSTTSKNIVIRADRQGSLQNKITVPKNIFLSEVLPSPEGADTENEFIEIFNANNFEADISGFKIKDKIGSVKTFTIPTGTKISANGFLAFKSSQTKISLNNTGDGVELLGPSGKVIDSIDFEKSQQGQSWSKTPAKSPASNQAGWEWAWTAKPTPGQANVIITIQAASTRSIRSIQTTSSPLTANIQNYPPRRKNFLAVAIATAIALSSALIAWRIKKNSAEI